MQGGFLRFIYQYLEQIPIPSAADSDRQAVVALVEQILRKKAESVEVDVSDLEAEINRRVEFLYFGEGDSYEDALANDAAEIRALLRPKLETAKLEFKETLYYDIRLGTIHGDRVIDVAKAICAMLNREGGTILIGVNDDAEIVGIERDLASFGKEGKLGTPDQFQRKLAEPFGVKLRPDPTDLIRVRFIPIDGKLVCRVDVTSDKATMFTLNEKVYVRRDGSSVEMSPADTAHWWQRRHREGE